METTRGRTRGLVIARIAGAPVVLTPGWFVLLAVVAVVYGRLLSGPDAPPVVMGLLAAAGLGLAVLVHELGHGLTGLVLRLRPVEFVLTLVGGHTAFRPGGRGPWAAAAVTAAGPAANLLLAGLLHLLQPLAESPALERATAMAVVLNLVLAVFNLVPALPLDGGRLWLEVAEGITGRPLAGLAPLGHLGRLLAVVTVLAGVWVHLRIWGWSGLLVVAAAASVSAGVWSGGSRAVRQARAHRDRPGATTPGPDHTDHPYHRDGPDPTGRT